MAATDFSRLSRALAERYRLRRELGRGGMATVYLADDLRHSRRVAVKVLRPELAASLGAERFLREITLTAGLDHPHILPLLDSGEADGLLYYVMPYVEGESLRDRLTRERQLPLDDTLAIAREVADALSYAHGHGIVHRDIKPENILLAAGHARVADFGIARAVTAAGAPSVTRTGIAVGTPAYMSPEQAAGEREVDPRSDVYGLASVVYEMLAGQPPFTGATAEAILARKLLEGVPNLRVVRDAVPPGVEEAIHTALATVPADRFATASQFADALERGRSRVGSVAPGGWRSYRRLPFVAVAAVLVMSGAAAWWVAQHRSISPAIDSLAVLPFKNLTNDPAQEYFVEGMREELTAELSKIAALKVIGATSAMRYQNAAEPIPRIAQELGVQGVVVGSVLREGDQVRINVQLIQGPTDRLLWAERYQRELRGILELQSEVALAIATEVQARLTAAERSRLTGTQSVDPRAHDAYLRGRVLMNRWPMPEHVGCAQAFQEAIERAPAWPDAYAGLANCNAVLSWAYPPEEVFPRARAAAQRALELDPDQGEAQIALGWVSLFHDWDWPAAERSARRAVELNPNSPSAHLLYSSYFVFVGAFEEAILEARKAVELDPLSLLANRNLAFVYQFARRYSESAAQARATSPLQPLVATVDLAWAHALQGHREQALELVQALLKEVSGSGAAIVGAILATLGQREPALELVGVAKAQRAEFYVDAFWIGVVYAALGEADEAMGWLEAAYKERSASMVQLKTNPALDPIRADPRFRDLLRRMNFPGGPGNQVVGR